MAPDMLFNLILKALLQTLQMVAVAGVIGTIIGLPIGVFLATSGRASCFRRRRSTGSSGSWSMQHARRPSSSSSSPSFHSPAS